MASHPPTRLQPGSPEWRSLVTPSKLSAILNISPYTDPYSCWHYMAGHIDIPETDDMRRGTYHESAVLREFFHRHPELKRIRGSNRTHRVSAWFAVTPDCLALTPDGRTAMIEIKTTAWWDEWGEEGTDEVPEHYYAQVVTAANGVKADLIYVFVLGPFWDYREYTVQPDPELAEQVLAKCYPFWLSVQNGDEPELSQTASAYETWTKVADPAVGAGDVVIPDELAGAHRAAQAAARRIKPLNAEIVNLLNEAGARRAVTASGDVIARKQKNSHGGVSLVGVAAKNPTSTPEESE